jgi:hypothetical protein
VYLSPGAYFGWRAQLETMAAEGRRNVMEHLAVSDISLTASCTAGSSMT